MTLETMSMLNQVLKILLPALVLAAIPLNVRGETWRKERQRPSVVGWAVISVGLLVAFVSGWTSWIDQKMKEDDKQAAAQSEKKALDDQTARFTMVVNNQKIAKDMLDQAGKNLAYAFEIGLTQVPVDLLTVWIKRKEIASILPQGLSPKDRFEFEKRLGPFQVSGDEPNPFDTQMSFSDRTPSLNNPIIGRTALKSFEGMFYSICKMELSSSAVTIAPPLHQRSDILFWNTDEVFHASLTRDFLILSFVPNHVHAIDLQSERIALSGVTRHMQIILGSGSSPMSHACTLPKEIRLEFSSPGFIANTGSFSIPRPDSSGKFRTFSPRIDFAISNSLKASELTQKPASPNTEPQQTVK